MEFSGKNADLNGPRCDNPGRRRFLAALCSAVGATLFLSLDKCESDDDTPPRLNKGKLEKIKSLTLLTQNCQGAPNRKNDTRIKSFEQIGGNILSMVDLPDIVLLQEVVFEQDVEILKSILSGKYSFHYDKKQILSLISGGLLVLVKKDFAKLLKNIETTFHKFSNQGNAFKGQSADIAIGKGFMDISFEVRDQCLSLINTHLLAIYSDNIDSDPNLKAQLEEVSAHIKKKIEASIGVILAGDLNISPDSALYSQIAKLLEDLSKDTGPTWEDEKLDHVLGNGVVAKSTVSVDQGKLPSGEPATDHKGILCKIAL